MCGPAWASLKIGYLKIHHDFPSKMGYTMINIPYSQTQPHISTTHCLNPTISAEITRKNDPKNHETKSTGRPFGCHFFSGVFFKDMRTNNQKQRSKQNNIK